MDISACAKCWQFYAQNNGEADRWRCKTGNEGRGINQMVVHCPTGRCRKIGQILKLILDQALFFCVSVRWPFGALHFSWYRHIKRISSRWKIQRFVFFFLLLLKNGSIPNMSGNGLPVGSYLAQLTVESITTLLCVVRQDQEVAEGPQYTFYTGWVIFLCICFLSLSFYIFHTLNVFEIPAKITKTCLRIYLPNKIWLTI